MKLEFPRIFQGDCWHCQNFLTFRPKVERGGLRCNDCGKLNQYDWTDKEYREWVRAYGQKQ